MAVFGVLLGSELAPAVTFGQIVHAGLQLTVPTVGGTDNRQ